jgi:hypothetical protein
VSAQNEILDPKDLKDLEAQLAAYAQRKHLSPATSDRWQAWQVGDRAALLTCAEELQLGENQLKDFLDWLEEIALRDETAIQAVLGQREIRTALTTRGSRNDKLKAVKTALRKMRYPRLTQLEASARAAVKALDLGRSVQILFPPAFEGDEITVTFHARNTQELQERLSRLQQRVDDGSFQRMFDVLDEV